jgi:uncharacterized protein YjbJ (UPF0337 family)
MSKQHLKGHFKEAERKIKEVAGNLVGNEHLEAKGKAEKIAADKRVLHEDLKQDVRNLA